MVLGYSVFMALHKYMYVHSTSDQPASSWCKKKEFAHWKNQTALTFSVAVFFSYLLFKLHVVFLPSQTFYLQSPSISM